MSIIPNYSTYICKADRQGVRTIRSSLLDYMPSVKWYTLRKLLWRGWNEKELCVSVWFYIAWMPDELSPAHNIVCWGSSVWHRSVEEKLWPITNQSDQSNCQDGLYTMMNRWSDQSNCQDGLHTMLDRSELRAAGPPGRGATGPPHGGHTGLVPGSGEERCLRAAGSTHIWRHSELFSPVNTKTSERASAAVVTICRVTYYIALIGCRSIQLSEEAFYFLVRLKHAP